MFGRIFGDAHGPRACAGDADQGQVAEPTATAWDAENGAGWPLMPTLRETV